ncbi:MAG: MinD/ParA family protein [Bacillota bacterium]
MTDQAEKLRGAAGRADLQSPALRKTPTGCRVVTVASGKGGVGKTSLVLNLALTLTKMHYRVVVFDADLGLANVDVLVNAVARYNLGDVISGERDIREIIIEGPLNLKIVPGGTGLYDLANLDQEQRRMLLEKLKDLENEGDVLIIDAAAGLSRSVISFIGAADDFILVTTPEPTALTDAYGVLKVIAEQGLRKQIYVVVNFARQMQQGDRAFERLKRVTRRYLPALELLYLGEMRYDDVVSKAVYDFVPFVLSYPRSAAALSLSRIAWRYTAGDNRCLVDERQAGFFGRLKDFFNERGP